MAFSKTARSRSLADKADNATTPHLPLPPYNTNPPRLKMTLKIRRATQVKKLRSPIVLRPTTATPGAKSTTACAQEMQQLLNCWRTSGVDSEACWEKARAVTVCAESSVSF